VSSKNLGICILTAIPPPRIAKLIKKETNKQMKQIKRKHLLSFFCSIKDRKDVKAKRIPSVNNTISVILTLYDM